MAGPANPSRKRKTFPDLDAPVPKPAPTKLIAESEDEELDEDSDAPEAVTLTGGRVVEEAKASALKAHQDRLQEKRKAQNKNREAFIKSTKSKSSAGARDEQASKTPQPIEEEEDSTDEGESEGEEGGGDPVLLARMAKAMQEAQEEDGVGSSDEDEDDDGPVFGDAPSSARLPDSIFAAAAAAHENIDKKRKPSVQKRDDKAKRRRVREGPSERVVGGRTLRITTALNAPPHLPSISTRKANNSVKGGNAFRRKWKKRDALKAQIRSRSGPARNFATAVQ